MFPNFSIWNCFQLPSFDASCSVVSTVASKSHKMSSIYSSINNNIADKVAVPDIGFVTRFKSGDIRVDYKDGSALTVSYYATLM